MSEFEYLAVFISIIFGISLTHILAGTIRSIYRKTAEESHLVWTLFILLVMILNWWTAYSWQDQQTWSFDLFMIIVFWSIAHYLTAITLYPPQAVDERWRTFWWYYLDYDPSLDSIRDEPEFQAMVEEIKADMAAQLERVREM